MSYFLIILAALFVSTLTFFSGFGLGTLLMPVFALFFPLDVAVAATAIVHLANNLFKVFLVGKKAHLKTVLVFGLPAVLFSLLGAVLLNYLSDIQPIYQYNFGEKIYKIEIIKVVIAFLLIIFSFFELIPKFREMTFGRKFLALGGSLSGFFGGLSGQQGALRAAFLSKVGLEKEQFVGTSVVSSVLVDISRLLVYGLYFMNNDVELFHDQTIVLLIILGTVSAFLGSFVGMKLLKKVTFKSMQLLMGVLLIIVAVLLGFGII